MNLKQIEFPVPARGYIPQKPPIVMIDNILSEDSEAFTTNFKISCDNVFVEDGRFREVGLMENIAQTCAAHVGFCSANNTVPLGVIGGISNFSLKRLPLVGETIVTTIRIIADVAKAKVVEAETRSGNDLIATCSMKVFVTDED